MATHDYQQNIGRILWYKLDSGPSKGQYRPAIVVQVHNYHYVNLQVFLDGTNDQPFSNEVGLTKWVSSVSYGKEEGQWLWPNEV